MFVKIEKQKYTTRVTLNRPDLHNAFNSDVIKELTDTFRSIVSDHTVRAVVLNGNGKSFCAGADIEWMRSMADFDYEKNLKDARLLFEMFEVIFECPVPVLGLVHGSVLGGGVGLAGVCDIVAAEKDTRFGFTEVKFGLVPAVISPFMMRKLPEHQAREAMMTGEIFGCEKAEKMGLIHFFGESEEAADYVQSKLEYVSSNGPEAVRSVKNLLRNVKNWSWSQSKDETVKLIAERRVSSEGQEGLRSFLDKRTPNWKTT